MHHSHTFYLKNQRARHDEDSWKHGNVRAKEHATKLPKIVREAKGVPYVWLLSGTETAL